MNWVQTLEEPLHLGHGLSTIFGLEDSWSSMATEFIGSNVLAFPAPKRKVKKSFLLTAAARTIGLEEVMGLTEKDALFRMQRLRWPEGQPICPRCESADCKTLALRQTFRCSKCYYEFGVMTYTTWHGAKLTARQILVILFLFATAPKGISAVTLALWIDLDWKSVYVILHKAREALYYSRSGLKLSGVVEIDGVYFRLKRRRPNLGRDAKSQIRDCRCVLSLVQRGGPAIAVVVEGETKAAVFSTIQKYVSEGAVLVTDEAPAYGFLRVFFEVHSINHSVEFARGEIYTNNAESLHARIRRAQRGIYHHIASGMALHLYIAELTFRHSYSDRDTRARWEDLVAFTLRQPPSTYKGYWDI